MYKLLDIYITKVWLYSIGNWQMHKRLLKTVDTLKFTLYKLFNLCTNSSSFWFHKEKMLILFSFLKMFSNKAEIKNILIFQ